MSHSYAYLDTSDFFSLLFTAFLLFPSGLTAQSGAFELLLRSPHQVSCIGAGNQAYPDGSPSSALRFNPASAAIGEGAGLSFFGRPVYSYCCLPITVRAVSVNLRPSRWPGGFAMEYAFQKVPAYRYYFAGPNVAPGDLVEPFESSIAVACGVSLGNAWSAGFAGRYARWNDRTSDKRRIEIWTYGAGGLWRSRLLNRPITAGISFMGFGVPFPDPLNGETIGPPAEFRLAMATSAVESSGLSIPLMISISKPIPATDEDGKARSSLASFFPSWKRFPRDATLHTAVGLQWSGLWHDGTIGIHARVLFGNATSGPSAGLANLFTLSVETGFEWKEVEAAVGFASEWHTMPHDPYTIAAPLPREMFSCSIHIPWFPMAGPDRRSVVADRVGGSIVAAGASWATHVGQYRADADIRYTDAPAFAFEASLPVKPQFAVVFETSYEKTKVIAECDCFPTGPVGIPFEGRHTIYSFMVALRFHPLVRLRGFYVQGGAGGVRIRTDWGNAFSSIAYAPLFALGTGMIIDVHGPLSVIPFTEFAVYPARIQASDVLHLGGYSMVQGGVKIGWSFGETFPR
ncbi:MAG: hypothetical protein QHI48_01650 [Bacteroidota bacterium]|nr:hypothetical protein [Bacteroidota bacterium]